MRPITFRRHGRVAIDRSSSVASVKEHLWMVAIASMLAMALPAHSQTPTYSDVAPILAARCVMCHSGSTPPAGLRLDTFEAVLKGGSKGAVVKPGTPAESELMRRIRGTSQPRMPMTGPPFLSDSEMATFERWIAGGLHRGPSVAAMSPAPPARRAGHLPRRGPHPCNTVREVPCRQRPDGRSARGLPTDVVRINVDDKRSRPCRSGQSRCK
jgi:hypothetical protein